MNKYNVAASIPVEAGDQLVQMHVEFRVYPSLHMAFEQNHEADSREHQRKSNRDHPENQEPEPQRADSHGEAAGM
jgi:hypothetical protein